MKNKCCSCDIQGGMACSDCGGDIHVQKQNCIKTPTREEQVEWKDGVIVEFTGYDCHTSEGGMEVYDKELSISQRGIVLGDEVIGCDYELSKDDFVNGVWKDGVDEDGSYHVEEYVEANLREPDWLPEALITAEKRVVDKCENCGEEKTIWWTDNVFWNSVMREEKFGSEKIGISCIPCFIKEAEKKWKVQGWRLIPEFEWKEKPTQP